VPAGSCGPGTRASTLTIGKSAYAGVRGDRASLGIGHEQIRFAAVGIADTGKEVRCPCWITE
jgi:hypothetical protein